MTKPNNRDDTRAALATAIKAHATAAKNLDDARAAEQRAASALFDAMRRVDEIEAQLAEPLDAEAVVSAFSSDDADVGLLTRSRDDLNARAASAQNEVDTLTTARERFASVIDDRRKAVDVSQRHLDAAVADVVRASVNVGALIGQLETMQAEVLARRCALWALHSAMPYGCDERAQIEKTLGRPWLLPESDWRHHPVGAAHKQAIDALRTNADAALPAS